MENARFTQWGELENFGTVSLIPYEKPNASSTQAFLAANMDYRRPISHNILLTIGDFMWLYAKWSFSQNICGWNGFMEEAKTGQSFTKSKILFMHLSMHHPPITTPSIQRYFWLLNSENHQPGGWHRDFRSASIHESSRHYSRCRHNFSSEKCNCPSWRFLFTDILPRVDRVHHGRQWARRSLSEYLILRYQQR